jgi:hypothetical protein
MIVETRRDKYMHDQDPFERAARDPDYRDHIRRMFITIHEKGYYVPDLPDEFADVPSCLGPHLQLCELLETAIADKKRAGTYVPLIDTDKLFALLVMLEG